MLLTNTINSQRICRLHTLSNTLLAESNRKHNQSAHVAYILLGKMQNNGPSDVQRVGNWKRRKMHSIPPAGRIF